MNGLQTPRPSDADAPARSHVVGSFRSTRCSAAAAVRRAGYGCCSRFRHSCQHSIWSSRGALRPTGCSDCFWCPWSAKWFWCRGSRSCCLQWRWLWQCSRTNRSAFSHGIACPQPQRPRCKNRRDSRSCILHRHHHQHLARERHAAAHFNIETAFPYQTIDLS